MFLFGIEHEVAFLDRSRQFCDYLSNSFHDIEEIIDRLPYYEQDYPYLFVGDAGIRVKRWYVEGLERFDESGNLLNCLVKGIEIRTPPQQTIRGAVDELTTSFQVLSREAAASGLIPVLTSYHPRRTRFIPDPPFNAYEESLLHQSPEDLTSLLAMLTYGPDLNISCQNMTTEQIIDAGRKFTYYSPYIVPFTYSSPFYDGQLWDGLSVRTFLRTGARPAAMVYLERPSELLSSNPTLTRIARTPHEVGRIEFKACDSCDDFTIYAAMLALLKGLLLDTTLEGRATVPDKEKHQFSARQGFASDEILAGAQEVLQAAERALAEDDDASLLAPLTQMLAQRTTSLSRMIDTFHDTGSIEESLLQSYISFSHDCVKDV